MYNFNGMQAEYRSACNLMTTRGTEYLLFCTEEEGSIRDECPYANRLCQRKILFSS